MTEYKPGLSWGEWILEVWRNEPARIADPDEVEKWKARLFLKERDTVIRPRKAAKVIPIDVRSSDNPGAADLWSGGEDA